VASELFLHGWDRTQLKLPRPLPGPQQAGSDATGLARHRRRMQNKTSR